MSRFMRILVILILINIIAFICLNIYYNKINKEIEQIDNKVYFIDEGGARN